eukprot:Awhi_evm2s14859
MFVAGDFRLEEVDLKSLKYLHTSDNGQNSANDINDESVPVVLDKIYLDTTFANDAIPKLSTRKQCLENLIQLIEEKDSAYFVYLNCKSFGYESLLMDLAKHFKTKVINNNMTTIV